MKVIPVIDGDLKKINIADIKSLNGALLDVPASLYCPVSVISSTYNPTEVSVLSKCENDENLSMISFDFQGLVTPALPPKDEPVKNLKQPMGKVLKVENVKFHKMNGFSTKSPKAYNMNHNILIFDNFSQSGALVDRSDFKNYISLAPYMKKFESEKEGETPKSFSL